MFSEEYIKYKKENDELLKTFLENTFFKAFRRKSRENKKERLANGYLHNFSSIELDIDYHCNLGCSYCYYSRYGKELYRGVKKIDYNIVLENLEKIMKFIAINNINCELEIFSGEFFNLPIWREVFDIIEKYLNKIEEKYRVSAITIPTNITAIIKNNIEDEVINYINRFREDLNVIIGLSASFDGPFMDDKNRRMVNGEKYDLDHYRKIINFMKKTFTCAHPMLYSENSEYMFDNILWFSNSTSILSTYLLQVRNPEWKIEQLKNFYYSIRAYIYNSFFKYGRDYRFFMDMIRSDNITLNTFSFVGRGLGCSMQSALYIQLQDMSIIPCHRLSYEGQVAGKLIINDDGSYDVDSQNVELLLAVQTVDKEKMGICESCMINTICSGMCLGSNYESTGEIFSPHPQVCLLEFVRVSAIIHELAEIGVLDKLYLKNISSVNKTKTRQIINILDMNIEDILDKHIF